MLILQIITLRWNKYFRGAPYSTIRNKHDWCFRLPEIVFDFDRTYGIPLHQLTFIQNIDGIYELSNNTKIFSEINLGIKQEGIQIIENADQIEVFIDFTNIKGKPKRFDHSNNQLKECAFVLNQGQSGVIKYNVRKSDQSTGESIYELKIINIGFIEVKLTNFFEVNKPDYVYTNFRTLY